MIDDGVIVPVSFEMKENRHFTGVIACKVSICYVRITN